MAKFRAAGKPIVSYGHYFEQPHYLLASYADAVYLHPMGQVLFNGVGSYSLYFKELIDSLKVNVHTFRVGTYKSFVEPYERNDMSEAAKLAGTSSTSIGSRLAASTSRSAAMRSSQRAASMGAFLESPELRVR